MTTSEGTARRSGSARQAMTTAGLSQQARRLTPEAIYRISATREEAVGLLHRYGYLT